MATQLYNILTFRILKTYELTPYQYLKAIELGYYEPIKCISVFKKEVTHYKVCGKVEKLIINLKA